MKRLIVLFLMLGFCSTSSALTLKEKKQFEDWKKYTTDESQSYVKTVKNKCGINIPLTLDEKMVTPFMEVNANAASYCDSMRSAISSMCDDATSKASIVKQVKSATCKNGPKEKVSLKLVSKNLEMTVGPGAANLDDAVKAFLENNLK